MESGVCISAGYALIHSRNRTEGTQIFNLIWSKAELEDI